MTPEQRSARAYAARALMEDPALQSGWGEIEAELRGQWEACWLPRKRDRIWNQLKHLSALRQKLASFAGQVRD